MKKNSFSSYAILLTATIGACTQTQFSQISSAKLSELERAVVAEIDVTKSPGAAIAIVNGDKIVYAKGFGSISCEGGAAVTPDTLFRIGSTTKMFTAAAAAVLADQKKVDLTQPVEAYVMGLPPSVGKLTLRSLMSQSSGLREMNTSVVSDDDEALGLNIAGWPQDSLFTAPNTIYSYSSANFWLTGLIVESVHGKPYPDAMADLLFAPLGMKRTFLRPRNAMTYPLALGHNRNGTEHSVNRPAANNAAIYPGGSIFSSVNELSRWAIAMLNGGVLDGKQALPAAVVEKLMMPQFYLPGGEAYYSYGMLGYDIGGVKTIGHGGVSKGYGATIFFAPEKRLALIVLTNSNGQTLAASRTKFNELFLGMNSQAEAMTGPADVPTPVMLERYVGKYTNQPQEWTVSLKDGNLYIASNGTTSQLKSVGKDEFSSELGPVAFVSNSKGEIDHIFSGLYAGRRSQ